MTFTLRTALGNVEYALNQRTAHAAWSYSFSVRAKQYRVSTGCRDLEQARIVTKKAIEDAQRAAEERHASGVDVAQGNGKMLAALATEYLDLKWPGDANRIGVSSYHETKSKLKIFCEVYKDAEGAHDNGALRASEDWKTVRAALQRFCFHRQKTDEVSARTIEGFQKTLSAWFSWIMAEPTTGATWAHNPAYKKGVGSGVPKLQLPQVSVSTKEAASDETVDTYLKHYRNHTNKHTMFPLLILMCSGTRPSGCGRIRWRDINLTSADEPSINNVDEKNTERFIPLSAWAADELRKYRAKHPPASEDCRVWAYTTNYGFAVIRKTGRNNPTFGKLTLGAIRRNAYTRLYEAGTPPQIAAQIMGNSVRIAERHYVQISKLKSHKHTIALGRQEKARNIVQLKAQA